MPDNNLGSGPGGEIKGWFTRVQNLLFGRPLATSEERAETIGAGAGVPIFGLDALSSAAYGPEAALTLLIPLGAAGIAYVLPISLSIIVLLFIVYFSYRQTIEAYPGGGGSYTVARENLGPYPGLLAGSALMIDYVLTAAVGISAGVGALVSAVPKLQPHTLGICLGILVLVTVANLRGVKDVGAVFMIPTYLFIGSLLGTVALGVVKSVFAGGHPKPVVAPPPPHAAVAMAGAWLLLQAFSSGCTAMTGVEAVSNGVKAFRDPAVKSAQRTLTIIIGILALMLAGIAFLVRAYGIGATDPGQPGYQSVLSMLIAAVTGKNVFYYVAMGSILAVLALSANTAFADFPRLCRAIAEDSYLPSSFAVRGRRLVYSQGVYLLALITAAVLILFRGVTDRLIPLYAVGAFLAFTLSQAGMVAHWNRVRCAGWRSSMAVNGLGAVTTGATVLVVAVAKFVEGAWVTVLLIPAIMIFMVAIRRHYAYIYKQTDDPKPLDMSGQKPPVVVVPIMRWSKISKKGLCFALEISPDVVALHIENEESVAEFKKQWPQLVEAPLRRAKLKPPELAVVTSPYRFVTQPILDFVQGLEQRYPDRQIAVLIPEMVEKHWFNYALHNQRASILKALLLLKGNQHVIVINVPWYLD